jgi:hypothetical protein
MIINQPVPNGHKVSLISHQIYQQIFDHHCGHHSMVRMGIITIDAVNSDENNCIFGRRYAMLSIDLGTYLTKKNE